MTIPTPAFVADDVELSSREQLFKRFFSIEKMTLRHRLFEGGWSEPIVRELFVRGDAVGVLLYDPRLKQIAMVEQFRIGAYRPDQPEAASPWLLEIVAGMFDSDETGEEVVYREVMEEAGIRPYSVTKICEYFVSPGGTDEKLHVYIACCDLSTAGGIHGLEEEGEDIRLHILNRDDVFDALYSGRFNNAASLVALQWLQMHHASIPSH